ncbi:MAG: hypothetical protein V2A79_11775 [Planctomycetota bacterium]
MLVPVTRTQVEPRQRTPPQGLQLIEVRQRYLVQELDPETLQPTPGSGLWSDYDGENIYADYVVNGSTVTTVQRYLPANGRRI